MKIISFQRADLAITDLTVTSERISVLDFTPSFMTLGIAILFEKPTVKPPVSRYQNIDSYASDQVKLYFSSDSRRSPSWTRSRKKCGCALAYHTLQFPCVSFVWGGFVDRNGRTRIRALKSRPVSRINSVFRTRCGSPLAHCCNKVNNIQTKNEFHHRINLNQSALTFAQVRKSKSRLHRFG